MLTAICVFLVVIKCKQSGLAPLRTASCPLRVHVNPFEVERERGKGVVVRGTSYTRGLEGRGGETEHHCVRRFRGLARSSFWYEYYEMKINEAEDMKK